MPRGYENLDATLIGLGLFATAGLMAGYHAWTMFGFLVAFAVMYGPLAVSAPVIWGYAMLPGALVWLILPGPMWWRALLTGVIPLPSIGYLAYANLAAHGTVAALKGAAMAYLLYLAGAGLACLWERHRARRRR